MHRNVHPRRLPKIFLRDKYVYDFSTTLSSIPLCHHTFFSVPSCSFSRRVRSPLVDAILKVRVFNLKTSGWLFQADICRGRLVGVRLRCFLFSLNSSLLRYSGRQAFESLLQPQGLLQRYCCNKKNKPRLQRSSKMPRNSDWSSKRFGGCFFQHQNMSLAANLTSLKLHRTRSFFTHDKLPCGRKAYTYALTVVGITSRYKEVEPLTSKDLGEVTKAFQTICRCSPLKWPQMLQVHPGRDHEFMGTVAK